MDAMEMMSGADLHQQQRPSRTSSSPSLVSPPSINHVAAAAAAAIGAGNGGSGGGGGSGGRRTQSVSAAYPNSNNNHNHPVASSSSAIAMVDRPMTADSHGGHNGHAINNAAAAVAATSMRSSVVGQQQGPGLGQGQGRQPIAGAGALGRQSLLLSRQSIQASSSSQQQQQQKQQQSQPHPSSSPPQKPSSVVDAPANQLLPRGAVAGEHFSPSLKQQIGALV